MKLDLVSFDGMMKDMHPMPGTRIKQWVVEARAAAKWERETCPKIDVPNHVDNYDDGSDTSTCRNVGTVPWTHLLHDSCTFCEGMWHGASGRDDVKAWLVEKAARPGTTANREVLSDEIEPEWAPMNLNPLIRAMHK